jgi:tetratricopeptide (TPR) repeat protein
MDHDLTASTNRLGDVEARMGHDDEALKWYQTAQQGLLALGKNRVLWPRDLALVDNNIAQVLMREGKYDQAQQNFKAAETEIRQALEHDPQNNTWQAVFGWTYDYWGQTLVRWAVQTKDRERLTQARTILGTALEKRTQAANGAPDTALNKLGVLNARANIAIADAIAHDWDKDFASAAGLYAEAADLIANTYIVHMKQYARPDRLLQMIEMRRNAASAYSKSSDTSNAKGQLEKALKFLSDYSGDLDRKTYEDTRKQLEEDSSAVKNKN